MLDPRRLQLLTEVAATGTVTAAAAASGYTPSAVSQQLRRLRQEVGVDLLEPRGRNVVLTPAGRALVDAAPEVFAALERAEGAARAIADHVHGTVRLGALASTFVDLVPAALADLTAASPEIDVQVVQLGDELLEELRVRHIDLAVEHHWSNRPDRDLDGLVVLPVLTEPVYVVAPDGRDLHDPAVLHEQAWIDHPCDQCGPAARDVVTGLGGSLERRPFVTDDITVMLRIAAMGTALTVVPGLACLHVPDGAALWRVPGVYRRIGAFVRQGTVDDPALRGVADHLAAAGRRLEEQFEELPAVGRLEFGRGGLPDSVH